jgi:hypothetical protein
MFSPVGKKGRGAGNNSFDAGSKAAIRNKESNGKKGKHLQTGDKIDRGLNNSTGKIEESQTTGGITGSLTETKKN